MPLRDRAAERTWHALMPIEEIDLERLPAAAEYKVLNRIGQGAFGEVCLIKFSVRAVPVPAVSPVAKLHLYRF